MSTKDADASKTHYTVEQQKLLDLDPRYLKYGKIATIAMFFLFMVYHILIYLFGVPTIFLENPIIGLFLFIGYFIMWFFFLKYLSVFDIQRLRFWFVLYVVAFFLNYCYIAFLQDAAFSHFIVYKLIVWAVCILSNFVIGIKLIRNETDFIGDLSFMGILFLLMALSLTIFALCESYYLIHLSHKKITILNHFYEYQSLAILFNLLVCIVEFIWLIRIYLLAEKWREYEM